MVDFGLIEPALKTETMGVDKKIEYTHINIDELTRKECRQPIAALILCIAF